ncbi:hypothetical protein HDU96_008700 [Phlyctochytrium bullatum]|nr:hypothetical protein HDU96_008700 [Phlyctochytrium bullatum]
MPGEQPNRFSTVNNRISAVTRFAQGAQGAQSANPDASNLSLAPSGGLPLHATSGKVSVTASKISLAAGPLSTLPSSNRPSETAAEGSLQSLNRHPGGATKSNESLVDGGGLKGKTGLEGIQEVGGSLSPHGMVAGSIADIEGKLPPETEVLQEKPKKKRTYLVAKRVPDDMFGRDPQYTEPTKKPIPITLVIPGIEKGPRRNEDGKLVPHTLLGDEEDFMEMEALAAQEANKALMCDDLGPEGSADAAAAVAAETALLEAEITNASNKKVLPEEEMEARKREERKRFMNRLHIFQRYREMREEHALRNWKRHSVEWAKMERELAKQTKKQPEHLLMCQLGEFRERLEEQALVEEAMALLEHRDIEFWGRDIQKDKTQNAEIGQYMEVVGHSVSNNYLESLTVAYLQRLEERSRRASKPFDQILPAESEQVVASHEASAEAKPPPVPPSPSPPKPQTSASVVDGPKKSKPSSPVRRISLYERRPNNLPKAISPHQPIPPIERDPLFPEIDALLKKEEEMAEGAPGQVAEVEPKAEVKLAMAASHMSFFVLLDEVSTSVLTVHNCGPTAVHFEWVRAVKENGLKVKSVYDGIQRFYFSHKHGVILPGSAFDFKIVFKSARPGIFAEQWVLQTKPNQTNLPPHSINLQGIAIEPDLFKEKRDSVEALLERRKAETVAKEVIDGILNSIKPKVLTAGLRRKLLSSRDDYLFSSRNSEYHVQYNTQTFTKFLQLAEEVFREIGYANLEWDRRIMTIYEAIELISAIEKRSSYFQKLNELVFSTKNSVNRGAHSPLYIICYDTLVDLADRVADTSETIRKKLSLPLVRSATQFFREDDNKVDLDDGRLPLKSAAIRLSLLTCFFHKDALRKATTPQVAQAADDKGKKGGAPGAPGKDAKGKAPPAKGPAGKGGKKGDAAADAEDTPQRPVLAKITRTRPPKEKRFQSATGQFINHDPSTSPQPDSSNQWSKERKLAEIQYRRVFAADVSALVTASVSRLCDLLEDVGESERDARALLDADAAAMAAGTASSTRPKGSAGARGGRKSEVVGGEAGEEGGEELEVGGVMRLGIGGEKDVADLRFGLQNMTAQKGGKVTSATAVNKRVGERERAQ